MLAKRGLAAVAGLAGLLTLVGGRPATTVVGARASQGVYPLSSKEAFMTTDELDYIRPGFDIQINNITIPTDNRPIVDLSFIDDLNQPLDRLGQVTPGALSFSFLIAWYNPDTRDYTSYITRVVTAAPPSTMVGNTAVQATSDSGGTFTDLAIGHATYRFGKALPPGFDPTKTTTLGIYATRNTTAIVGKNYYANVEYDFRPDGQAVTAKWDVIRNTACNTCHDPLAEHGGSRQDVKLCAICHNPQTSDPNTGNPLDLKVLIHKIHDGSSLPSVVAGTPYQIIGFQQSVNDFSTVVFPQDIRNCKTCHAAPAADAPIWYTDPSRAACGSCHDDIDWTTGANHPAGAQADDSACAACHAPQGDHEWDAAITDAHTVPFKSKQLKGLNAKIVSVSKTAPGQNPTVQFQLTQNDGSAVNPSTLGSNLAVIMGGPTTDYSVDPNGFRETASGASFDGTTATYTFTHAVPANATGTWAFALEGRRTITLSPAPRLGPATVTESLFNPVSYSAVTDTAPVPRRAVVEISNCNTCHDELMLHGGLRKNTEMCVICHNPNENDSAYRPAAQLPVESVDFKRMIHRIHTGENLTQDFTIYGFGGSKNTFNDVRFPGDRRDCEKCHVPGAEEVSETPPAGLLPTVTLRDYFSPMQHYTAACLGCHDTKDAAAHAFVMTAPFGEACAVCHGTGADFAVDLVHAR